MGIVDVTGVFALAEERLSIKKSAKTSIMINIFAILISNYKL